MAKVEEKTRERIETLLRQAESAWKELPAVDAEFDVLDEIERLDYVYEWPLEEERLSELGSYSRVGAMSEEQMERYGKLERLVGKNRPVLERIYGKAGL